MTTLIILKYNSFSIKTQNPESIKEKYLFNEK